MNKKSERLKTIVELNVAQEKKALEVFGEVQKKQVQIQMQLDHLVKYRKEYQDKLDALCRGGALIGQLLEFRAFIDKLDQAIGGQEKTLHNLDLELNRVRSHWIGLHNRTKSLQNLCDKATADEVRLQEKREQNEQDDRVSSGYRNNGGMKNA